MHKATIVRDAAGKPTGLKDISNLGMIEGAISVLTSAASIDTVILPNGLIDKVVQLGVPVVGGALLQMQLGQGAIGIPFKKQV